MIIKLWRAPLEPKTLEYSTNCQEINENPIRKISGKKNFEVGRFKRVCSAITAFALRLGQLTASQVALWYLFWQQPVVASKTSSNERHSWKANGSVSHNSICSRAALWRRARNFLRQSHFCAEFRSAELQLILFSTIYQQHQQVTFLRADFSGFNRKQATQLRQKFALERNYTNFFGGI